MSIRSALSFVAVAALVAAGCASDSESSGSEETTTTAAATDTTEATTTTVAETTTTTEAPTTESSETSAAPVEADPLTLAESILLTGSDLGVGWDEGPPDSDNIDVSGIPGCEGVDALVNNDGNLAEADSAEFTMGETEVNHSVRIYGSTQEATDIVLAWAQDGVAECVLGAIQQDLQGAFDAGQLAPYTDGEIVPRVFDSLVGEPRAANLELTTTLTGDGQPTIVIVDDVYFIQVGRAVSNVSIRNLEELWDGTEEVLELVAARMGEYAIE